MLIYEYIYIYVHSCIYIYIYIYVYIYIYIYIWGCAILGVTKRVDKWTCGNRGLKRPPDTSWAVGAADLARLRLLAYWLGFFRPLSRVWKNEKHIRTTRAPNVFRQRLICFDRASTGGYYVLPCSFISLGKIDFSVELEGVENDTCVKCLSPRGHF